MIAFGPVPSRRLGRSLGINNIPPKVCTYSCVYCQLGRTMKMQVDRRAFYEPEETLKVVRDKVEKARARGEPIDYLTFVADGEPSLDVHLGREIELRREARRCQTFPAGSGRHSISCWLPSGYGRFCDIARGPLRHGRLYPG